MIKIITKGKIPFLVVSIDEVKRIDNDDGSVLWEIDSSKLPKDIKLVFPPMRFTELSEQACSEYVDKIYEGGIDPYPGSIENAVMITTFYPDYNEEHVFKKDVPYIIAKDSLKSLLISEDVWLKYWITELIIIKTRNHGAGLNSLDADEKLNKAFDDILLIKIKE